MSQTYFAILTAVGEAKLANATALGTTVQITQMAVGDGNGATPVPARTQTALTHEVRRAALNRLSIDSANSSQIIAEQVIPENVGGWWIRELGLYDSAGDLVAIANCAPTYKPQLAEGSGRTQVIRLVLIVSATASVELKIDPSVVLATRGYVDAQDAAHVAAADPHPQYAPKESPTFTGTPKAPTPAAGDTSTRLATTAYVMAAIAALVNGSPGALDTLKELADALGDDANFAATMTNLLALKAPLASPVLTGAPKAPTPAQFDNDTSIATTAFVKAAGHQFSSFVSYAATSNIPAAACGKIVQLSQSAAATYTLPAAADCPNGGVIYLKHTGSSTATVARAGADAITAGSGTVTSITLGVGDDLVLVSNGNNAWFSVGGTAEFAFASAFGATFGTNGYQKLPSGLIVQWGTVSYSALVTAFTFPIAFPSALFSVAASMQDQSGGTTSLFPYVTAASRTLSGASLTVNGFASGSGSVNYIALGK
jgi:hypothetical protein